MKTLKRDRISKTWCLQVRARSRGVWWSATGSSWQLNRRAILATRWLTLRLSKTSAPVSSKSSSIASLTAPKTQATSWWLRLSNQSNRLLWPIGKTLRIWKDWVQPRAWCLRIWLVKRPLSVYKSPPLCKAPGTTPQVQSKVAQTWVTRPLSAHWPTC